MHTKITFAFVIALCGTLCTDEQPIKALLVAGGCCHDYKSQKSIITEGISARANVQWVIIHEGDGKDLDFVQRILKPHKAGKPAVILHCAVHSYRTAPFPDVTPWFEFTGLQSTGHGAQLPIA